MLKINVEYLSFTQPAFADREKKTVISYVYHKDMEDLYGILFYYKDKDTFKFYREIDVKANERDIVILDEMKKFIRKQLGVINAEMGLKAEMSYTVIKKDKDGNIISEEKKKTEKII